MKLPGWRHEVGRAGRQTWSSSSTTAGRVPTRPLEPAFRRSKALPTATNWSRPAAKQVRSVKFHDLSENCDAVPSRCDLHSLSGGQRECGSLWWELLVEQA